MVAPRVARRTATSQDATHRPPRFQARAASSTANASCAFSPVDNQQIRIVAVFPGASKRRLITSYIERKSSAPDDAS